MVAIRKQKRAVGIWVTTRMFRAIAGAAKQQRISKAAWLTRAAEEKLARDAAAKKSAKKCDGEAA